MLAYRILPAVASCLPLAVLLTGTQVPSPPPGQETSLVRVAGRVVDGRSGAPVARARVRVVGVDERVDRSGNVVSIVGEASSVDIQASDVGAFEVRVTPGRYGVQVRRTGYLPGGYGQRAPGVRLHDLLIEAGRDQLNLTIRLWKLGVISGRVLDDQAHPVAGMTVRALRRVYNGGAASYVPAAATTTDDTGGYRLTDLVPAHYVVAAVSSVMSAPSELLDVLEQNDDQARTLATALAGSGARLPEEVSRFGSQAVGWDGPAGVLPAGSSPGDSPGFQVYRTSFYPGATDITAANALAIEAGSDLAGIDFTLQPVPSVTVSGRLNTQDGPARFVALRLVPMTIADVIPATGFETSTTVSGANGEFRLVGVPAGAYRLEALVSPRAWRPRPNSASSLLSSVPTGRSSFYRTPPSADEPLRWLRDTVVVGDAHVTGVSATLQEGSRLIGRIRFESRQPVAPGASAGASIHLSTIDGRMAAVAVPVAASADGTFVTARYPPGRYRIKIGVPGASWRVREILVGGRDVQDDLVLGVSDVTGATIVLTDQETTLSGTVVPPDDWDERDGAVAIFPADVDSWIERGMNPALARTVPVRQGRFTARHMRPGSYCVALVSITAAAVDLSDPDRVRELVGRSQIVRVAEGENSVTLRSRPPGR